MTGIVTRFQICAAGTTREDCIDMLDRMGLSFMEQVGGAPWLIPDDDVKKIEASAVSGVLGDSQGFCYFGIRSYDFRGPIVIVPHAIYHDGFQVQHANE